MIAKSLIVIITIVLRFYFFIIILNIFKIHNLLYYNYLLVYQVFIYLEGKIIL